MQWLLAATLAVVTAILAWSVTNIASRPDEMTPLTTRVNTTYDYVVVGGGTAGCVLAARLSEDSDVTVLLLEAGPDDRGLASVYTPALVGTMYHSYLDWDYYTVPQLHSHAGYKDKKSFWPRGRMLGGSSNLNTMIYLRGSHHDYDRWAELGNEGWSYSDVLPYFRKSEDNQNMDYVQGGYHGQGGEVKVDSSNTMPLTDLWLKAGTQMGMDIIDPNAVHKEGVFQTQGTFYKGERWGMSRAFIHPALTRPNLHVLVNAHATRVVIEHQRAVGVEFVRNSRRFTVQVSKEVILSAGSIGSPQLLLLSGIGPRQHLQDLHIPVVADLPVGDNLHDHMVYDFQVGLQEPVSVSSRELQSPWTRLQYQLFRTGHLSSPVSHEVNLLVCTDQDSRSLQWPDVQLMLLGRNFDTNKLRVYGYSQESLQEAARRDTFQHAFTCLATLLRPVSRGTLRLATSDPFTYPLIDPQYLQYPEDVDVLVRGIRECQRLMRTPAMQGVGAEPSDSPSRFCSHHGYDSDEYWRCMVRRNAQTVYHPVGTCSMGPPGHPKAVVDPQLRVQGVKGLRVADASVMPVIVSSNTNAAVIMIGEHAADLIRSHRRQTTVTSPTDD